jgi:RNA polymerase sigma factor (sigma-70 family)
LSFARDRPSPTPAAAADFFGEIVRRKGVSPVCDSKTHSSLFVRLRLDPKDEAAWRDFVGRYGRLIYAWARDRGLADADCEDVRQKVLTRLVAVLRTFEYDRTQSFRGYVCVMTQRAVSDLLDECRRRPRAGGEGVAGLLASVAARDDLGRRLEEEHEREIFEEACRRVQRDVSPEAWRRYWLTVPAGLGGGGLSPKEAAAREGVPVARIYQARYLITPRLTEEVRRVGGDEPH